MDTRYIDNNYLDDNEELSRPMHTFDSHASFISARSITHQNRKGSNASVSMTMTPTTQFLMEPTLIKLKPDDSEDDTLIQVKYEAPNVLFVIVTGITGIVIGAILHRFDLSMTVAQWIGLVGHLFNNILECITTPLIFTSVCICFSNMVITRKAWGVVIRLSIYLLIAAFLGAITGLVMGYAFSGSFKVNKAIPMPPTPIQLAIQCPNDKFISIGPKNELICASPSPQNITAIFIATNVEGIAMKKTDLTETITKFGFQIANFFYMMFASNITDAFATNQTLGVTLIAMFIGAALILTENEVTGTNKNNTKTSTHVRTTATDDDGYDDGAIGDDGANQQAPPAAAEDNYALVLLQQINTVLEVILNWIIGFTPMAVFSIMTSAILQGSFSSQNFKATVYFVIAFAMILIVYFFLVICTAYFILVRKNPFRFLQYLPPAQMFIFASSDSVATLPILMRCVDSSQQVSRTLSHWVLSLGVTLSMSGTAAYFALSILFMTYSDGLEEQLNAGRVIGLIFLSALSSIGISPAANMTLARVVTIWVTLFKGPLPTSFAYLVGIEWLMVRMRCVQNITTTAYIASIIADELDESAEDEEDRRVSFDETSRSSDL